MKVVAFNGSPRPDGNTAALIQAVFGALGQEGIQTEMVQVGGKRVRGCTACFQCFTQRNRKCAIQDDALNEWMAKMEEADGIILASPTYFADVTSEIKALIDRAGMTSRANEDLFRRKVGAAVVAVRRAGALHAFDTLNHFFLIGQMIIPGSCYWNIGVGREKGAVKKDEEGLLTMQTLGKNMAWLLKRLARNI